MAEKNKAINSMIFFILCSLSIYGQKKTIKEKQISWISFICVRKRQNFEVL
ncbi:hypothetical protein NU08_4261 [Flavobacterium anhuiense]|uniref:Uncharacterized protein n=1 Tax=Flavobacterium anhuiense TaxID=459526 RepID=A0A444VSX0_9FLAO|nr:hypothetical protein NU08_4261 [Flavobacterium anhuiense]